MLQRMCNFEDIHGSMTLSWDLLLPACFIPVDLTTVSHPTTVAPTPWMKTILIYPKKVVIYGNYNHEDVRDSNKDAVKNSAC